MPGVTDEHRDGAVSGRGIDPATRAGYVEHPPRMGFFTDTSLCIGCKACEVACKEWNGVPEDGLVLTGMSYDNTGGLGASTWRHVAFIEKRAGPAQHADRSAPGDGEVRHELQWLMSSDVCKHCTEAACLDVCPTGALMRTEFGTVVVQDDVCNGCGYCVSACPFGVIGRRESDGGAHKCTLCYDRLGDGLVPACAKACPTESILFGPVEELRARAHERVVELQEAGRAEARLYGADPDDGIGGAGAFFLLLDEPEVYGLPPDPVVPTREQPRMWRHAGIAAAGWRSPPLPHVCGAGRERAKRANARSADEHRRGDEEVVPAVEVRSYYGLPVLKETVWAADIAAYLFLGGLAGASSTLAAGAHLSGHRDLAGTAKIGSSRRDRSVARGPRPRPRPPVTVPQHAAGGQGDLADERRQLGARRAMPRWRSLLRRLT